jgi:hypothetical protein
LENFKNHQRPSPKLSNNITFSRSQPRAIVPLTRFCQTTPWSSRIYSYSVFPSMLHFFLTVHWIRLVLLTLFREQAQFTILHTWQLLIPWQPRQYPFEVGRCFRSPLPRMYTRYLPYI